MTAHRDRDEIERWQKKVWELHESALAEARLLREQRRPLPKFLGNVYIPLESIDSDLSALYWMSNIPAREVFEICDCSHVFHVPEEIGIGQLFGENCTVCNGPHIVRSRSEANLRLSGGGLSDVCSDCRDSHQKQRQEEYQTKLRTWLSDARRMPYRDYLKTQHWDEVRRAAVRRARGACQLCAAKAHLHVHHRTYVRLGQEIASDVIALCGACHAAFHDRRALADRGRASA